MKLQSSDSKSNRLNSYTVVCVKLRNSFNIAGTPLAKFDPSSRFTVDV